MAVIRFSSTVCLVLLLVTAFCISMCKTAAGEQNISVIPKPVSVEPGKGFFILKPGFVIAADGESSRVGGYLAAFFSPALGTEPIVAAYNKKKKYTGAIILKIDKNKMKLGDEGYELNVRPDNITVTAESQAGLFHGVQTLRQLLPPQIESREKVTGVEWKVPCVKITDYPRFQWRGLMLDTGRHFFPKEFVLKYIDLMSMYKLNRLHLHLTEDQGWRLEIKKYPELTKIGAWRGKSKTADLFMNPSGKAHGGFYTQDDMREIIAYAAERFVTIVPEIEMPGHSQAALASVPGLSCRDQKFKVLTHWGVNQEVYCAGNEKVFEFLQDVLTEVAELFPGGYIHIGGDEVPKDRWKECPKCQARIKAEGLKDESELQSYFVKRIERFINSKGKRLIGWDEILEGGLPPRATVMSWRGMDGGIAAAQSGHDVIMSPTSNCYLDYAQSPADEPGAIGGPDGPKLPLCKVYSFEPAPDALTPDQAKHILGAQANLWTEYVEETKHAEYMAYPRAEAIAELTWTPKELKNWDDFLSRVITDDARLDIIGVNYRPPRENETTLCEQKP